MRVLLINTPALFERPVSRSMAGGLGFDGNADMVLPPLDLAYLAAHLRAGGHDVGLFDADGLGWDRATTLQKVAERPCDALICAASLPTLYNDCAFLQEVRQRHRGPVYAKTNVPDRAVLKEMLERSRADGVIYGEPEVSICGIVEGRTTDNLVCVRDGDVVFGERRSVEDVDQLLMPARDLLPNDRYTYPLLGQGLTTVQSSRGCPFPCGYYCPYPLVEGKKWRARSPKRVADELEEIVRVHGIGKVLFRDATFTLDKDRAAAICDEILARGLDLAWWCETRVDRLDRPLLEKLRAAGCLGINIGVETGDEDVMVGQAKRGLSMEKLIRLRNDAKEVGLALHFLMLVGFPDETRKSILASYDLIQDLQPESLGITLITPYPGTPLHEEAAKRGWIEKGTTWSDYGGHQPVMHTDNLATGELVHGLEALHRGFRLLKMRGKVDDAALQQAMDEDYMRLQVWASEEGDRRKTTGESEGQKDPLPRASRLTPHASPPLVSVVIPTHNRRDDLLRCLKALDAQTLPAPAFEVIVSDDGSTDRTRETVEGYRPPYALKYLRQENRGPASARNAGVQAASGEIVLFIGDDISADPRLLERHVAAHRSGPQELAVLGHTAWPPDLSVNELMRYVTDVTPLQFGFHQIQDRNNVPFGFFYTSNVSVKRAFLMGGDLFDEGFPYAAFEDIELEYRLRQRGMRMVYDPEAIGYHYHPTDLKRFSERQYRAGRSAVHFHRTHPDPALDADVLLVSRLSKETLSPPEEIERLRSAAAEIEKMDLSKFSAIAVGGRPLEAQFRDVLHKFYARVLQASYGRGVQDALREAPPLTSNPEPSATHQPGPISVTQVFPPTVSVIIPVFNNLSYTQRCLETLFAHSDGVPYEVVVVDNASTDGTRAYLEGLGDRVRTIFNTSNVGFGMANNQAAAVARGQYLLYLNNDTEARPGWLREMVRLMESDSSIGVVGSKLLYPDGKVQHVGVAFRDGCRPSHLYRGEDLADHPIVNRVREVQAVTGACLMLRRGIVEEPAVFDEAFVNGFEDVDLCLRVREKGYRVVYCPTSVLVHHESKTPGRKAHDVWNYKLLKQRWEGCVQADFDQTLEQDGFRRASHNDAHWTWDPQRMQPPQPRPPIGPKRRDPLQPKLSLILPVRDRVVDLDRCLSGVVLHSKGLPYEIIVVDNASADETAHYMERVNDEEVMAIFSSEDLGFGRAANRAAKLARGEWLLFLTADLKPGQGWLKGVLKRIERDPQREAVRPGRAACLLIRREAFHRAGGFGAQADAEEAMNDLCARVTSPEPKVQSQTQDAGPRTQDSPPPPKVSVVIPVFNGLEDTRRCLPALAQNTEGVDYEVIVVDNASSDGTPEFLKKEAQRWGGRLRVIRHTQNLGFAKGCNAGARASTGDRVLFLNNDTIPQPGWLREMVQVMASDDRVGVVGSKLLYPDTKRVQHAGIELINGVPDHPFRGAAPDDPRVCQTRDLDMVTGACLMARKDLFDRLGGFDEDYVNGVEDVDLCLRVRDAGYRVVYCATSVVEHHEGRSAGRFNHVRENLQRFVGRWQGRFDARGRFVPASLRGVWEGSFFVRHSLALVNREVCAALLRSGRCELSLIPYEADEFGPESDPERLRPLAGRMRAPLTGPAEFHVRHQWPPNFEPPPSGHWVMIQPWEFGRLPKAWVRPMTEEVDEIWVPSAFVRQCYVESGIPAEKVFVVPNGVNPDLFRPNAQPMNLPTPRSFRFLFVGGTIYRKGIDALLDAYRRAFRRSDDVCLVIKDMGQATFYKGQNAADLIRALQADPDAPEILYLTDPLPDRDVPRLYAACQCLVHPYRGEGFGLPVAEAMACGLPVLVTQGGACDDFCSEKTACFIPARKVPIAFKEETAGQAWLLEPDREALAARMRWMVERPGEAKAMGARASAFIRANVTWERTAAAVSERLRALKGKPTLRGKNRAAQHLAAAEAAQAAGDLAGAVEAARRATETAPAWARTHNDLGRYLYRSGNVAAARAAFERAAQADPALAEAHSNLGVLLWETGKQEEALEAFERAAQADPENVDLLYNLGAIHAQVGDAQRAAAFFERCLALRPDDAGVRAQLDALDPSPHSPPPMGEGS